MNTNTEMTQSRLPFSLIHVACIANLVLIALSFTPWFSGTAQSAGFADHALGWARFGGFRADFVWLFLSSGALFLLGIASARKAFQGDRRAQTAVMFCGLEVVFYLLYLLHSLLSGLLYFG